MRQGPGGAGFTVDWVTDGHAGELALVNGATVALDDAPRGGLQVTVWFPRQ